MNADVPGQLGGDDRDDLLTRDRPIHQLPPGKYVLRALVSSVGKPVKTLARGFEVSPPKVLMTSADGLGADVGGHRAVPAGPGTGDDAGVPA